MASPVLSSLTANSNSLGRQSNNLTQLAFITVRPFQSRTVFLYLSGMKKLLFSIMLVCAFSAGAFAQILPSKTPEADSIAFAKVRARMDSIRQYRPTVGLVLAGGGARGLAHLGVIKYMEELGIPVDLVTGTSMGGLIGGMYSMGYKHDQLDSLIRDINWPKMMSDDVPKTYLTYKLKQYRDKYLIRIPFHYDEEDLAARFEQENILDKMSEEAGHGSGEAMRDAINKMGIGMPDGFLYGLNVRNTLSSVSVGYQDSICFANLPIPYACVATDMLSMTPKYWTSGSLTKAMRSTMAIPFYFRAVRGDGEILLDGGMRNNYPADLAREMGADIIIGSQMSTHRGLNDLNSPMDLLFQTITLLSAEAVGQAKEMLDMDVNHELKGYNMLSFDDKSVDDIINQGYQNALDHKELFESIAAKVVGKQEPPVSHPAPAVNLAQQKVRVDKVKFNGLTEEEQQIILRTSDYPADGMYDREIVEKMLNNIYGTNAFEAVTYHMEGSREPYTLVFNCQKGQVHDAAFSLRADTDEYVAVALHLGLGTRRISGPRLTTDLKLGTNPYLKIDGALKSKHGLPTVGIAARTRIINAISGYMQSSQEKLLNIGVDAYIEDCRLRMGALRAGVSFEMNPWERYMEYSYQRFGWDWESHWLSAFASLKLDTFNDGYFPTRGMRLSLDGRYVFAGKAAILNPDIYHPVEEPVTTEGSKVPGYLSTIASMEGAFTIGDNFTIHPKLYAGFYWVPMVKDPANYDDIRHYMNPIHLVTVGGFIPNRYVEHQIPFFGFPTDYRNCLPKSAMAQLDLRYRISHKNFITARAGMYEDVYELADISYTRPDLAYGLEFARQSMVGPLKIAAQWCWMTRFTVYASVGFDF